MPPRKEKEIQPPANPKFIEWLEEMVEEANEKDLINYKFTLLKALKNLRTVTEPLPPKSLIKVSGIGPAIVKKLEQRVEKYFKDGNDVADLYLPGAILNSDLTSRYAAPEVASANQTAISSQPNGTAVTTKRRRKEKRYIPTYRSGAYAILICMYEHFMRGELYMTKFEIQERAQQYADSSMIETEPGKKYHTAWTAMSSLITKEFVVKMGMPAKYSLTDDGQELGELLLKKSLEFENQDPSIKSQSQSVVADTRHAEQLKSLSQTPVTRPVAAVASLPFQFWYLTSQKSRVREKLQAEVKIGDNGVSFKIEFHSKQADHAFLIHAEKESAFPDASGMLVGYLDDHKAPEICPGIDPLLFVDQHPTNSLEDQSSNPPSKTRQTVAKKASKLPSQKVPMGSSDNISSVPIGECTLNLPPVPAHLTCFPGEEPLTSIQMDTSNIQPTVMPKGSYRIKLLVDNREIRSKKDRDFMSNELTKRGIDCQARSLSAGDAMWLAVGGDTSGVQEIVLDFIVERKRLDDLVSSIKDGRFFEQKSRLLRSGIRNVFYIIEEIDGHSVNQFGRDALRSAMATVQTFSGFHVKRTINADDTVRLLASLTEYIQQRYLAEGTIYSLSAHVLEKETCVALRDQMESKHGKSFHFPYDAFSELNSKSGTSTLRDVWFKQIATVRGISAEKALTIVDAYPTPFSLLSALRQLSSMEERLALLKKLNGPIQRRNLGENVLRRLINILCLDRYPVET